MNTIKEAYDTQIKNEIKNEIRQHKEQIKYSRNCIKELKDRLK